MRVYDATIEYNDGELQTMDTALAIIETDEERKLYDLGEYDKLLKGSGFTDDDIYFYFDTADGDDEPYVGMSYSDVDDCDWFRITNIHGEAIKV